MSWGIDLWICSPGCMCLIRKYGNSCSSACHSTENHLHSDLCSYPGLFPVHLGFCDWKKCIKTITFRAICRMLKLHKEYLNAKQKTFEEFIIKRTISHMVTKGFQHEHTRIICLPQGITQPNPTNPVYTDSSSSHYFCSYYKRIVC